MYNPRDIIDLLADNVRKTRNPFGIPKPLVNSWWKKAVVAEEGDALLFTGLMYQFGPYIEKSTGYLDRFEGTFWADYIRLAKYVPKLLSGLGLALLASGEEKKKYNGMLQNIVTILARSKVDFFYRPELDNYSGILLYDLGDQDSFVRHAEFVAGRLKQAGVKKLITVDPHTTYAVKVLFPKYIGERFDVKTYFELINFSSKNSNGRVTIHDSCFYGRHLELSDVPREVLAKLGVECVPVRNSGSYTNCCGGPAESVSPRLSREVLQRRIEELRSNGTPIVAMCPICYGHLSKSGERIEDLATLIAKCA